MEFQNNQQGLPGKIRRQKIIAKFTTKLYTVFIYSLLQQLWTRNCRKYNKYMYVGYKMRIDPLNAELNPFCHLLALLWAHRSLHVNRVRVKRLFTDRTFRYRGEAKSQLFHKVYRTVRSLSDLQIPLCPMNGIGIFWINERVGCRSLLVCVWRKKYII